MATNAATVNVNMGGIITDMTDPTGSIECLCEGNLGYFFPANADGLIGWEKEVPNVAPWPSAAEMHALCCTCGNLFSHADLEASAGPNVAPVKVVDFNAPMHKANLEAFQTLIG